MYLEDDFLYNQNGDSIGRKNNNTNQLTQYSFDSFGKLVSLKSGTNTFEYLTDGFGRRALNNINGKLQSIYIYMDQIRLAGVVGANGSAYQKFGYGAKILVPDLIVMNGEIYRIITDHLGSVRVVLRLSDNTIVQEMLHDEFGRVLKNTAPGFQPFGFAGGLVDSNTGLVQFGARWYDPQIGRWVSKDPTGFNGGDTNLYAYVGGDPMSYVDPTGLKINDMTGGKIPVEIVNSPLYRQLDAMSGVINLALDFGLEAAGLTTILSSNRQNVAINPDNQLSHADLLDTYIHELNHALLNFSHDGKTSEFYDTNIVLPTQIRRNLKGPQSCPPK
ncbi:hypothetical protein CIK05_06695 [Bdellovibrio sp. qaytius]|nr:hypothetical protein CIK05_06695 [Bdellovibrio sp. qaytius]